MCSVLMKTNEIIGFSIYNLFILGTETQKVETKICDTTCTELLPRKKGV